MDRKENLPPKAQQKAIDGILFGTRQRPATHIPRRRIRGSHADSHGVTERRPNHQKSSVPMGGQSMTAAVAAPDTSVAESELKTMRLDEVPAALAHPPKQKRRWFWWRRKSHKTKRPWSWKKKLLVGFLVIVLLVGFILGVLAYKGFSSAKKVFKGGGSAIALQKYVPPSLLKGEGDGRINILLLGIGGPNHDGSDLTDTIMLASIDPVNNTAALLSVPRDLWVTLPKHGSMKLNAAYETGKYGYLGRIDASNNNTEAVKAGFASVDSELESVLGIPIHYNVLVNFQAFKQGVDAVGGITVNVPTALYDPTMAWQNHGNPILAAAGTQQFDGDKALMYVRSRETSSDFARGQRQRAVIVALGQKIFSLGTFSDPLKLSQLLDAFGNNVVTDLAIHDLTRLYDITKGVALDTVQSIGLTDPGHNFLRTGMIGAQSTVFPIAGLNNYDVIQAYVRNTLRDGYLTKENANIAVINGTSTPNAATTAADTLKSFGYTVGTVGDAPTKGYQKTIIVDMTKGKKPYTGQYLMKRYGVTKLVDSLPDPAIQTQNADFVIILGQHETSSSQN